MRRQPGAFGAEEDGAGRVERNGVQRRAVERGGDDAKPRARHARTASPASDTLTTGSLNALPIAPRSAFQPYGSADAPPQSRRLLPRPRRRARWLPGCPGPAHRRPRARAVDRPRRRVEVARDGARERHHARRRARRAHRLQHSLGHDDTADAGASVVEQASDHRVVERPLGERCGLDRQPARQASSSRVAPSTSTCRRRLGVARRRRNRATSACWRLVRRTIGWGGVARSSDGRPVQHSKYAKIARRFQPSRQMGREGFSSGHHRHEEPSRPFC